MIAVPQHAFRGKLGLDSLVLAGRLGRLRVVTQVAATEEEDFLPRLLRWLR